MLLRAVALLVLLAPLPALACPGDCDGDGTVVINELIVGVEIALGSAGVDRCAAADVDGNGQVEIQELIAAVDADLSGCAVATPTVTPGPLHCGDGTADPDEECDDGNTIAGDGCSEICLVEPSTARCGDGVLSGAEECDRGPLNDDSIYGGCTNQCRFAPHCGDGITNGPEECDDGSRANIVTYGNMSGCTFECKYPHYCGDAIVDADEGEQCDYGPRNGDSTWVCSRDCKVYLD